MWETGQSNLRCWYVNLEEPLRRTSIGFDSMDYLLDIVISPDRSSWHWKDEDEFEAILRAGVITETEGRSIREEGRRAIRKMEENRSPFCDGWEFWRPPPGWTLPELAEGWENIKDGWN
jgi:predicted RNA-binding protein associated with RNAse of E/G family